MIPLPGLRAQRLRAMLTQQELADLARVHRLTVVRLENGTSTAVQSTVRQLASALHCDVQDLTTSAAV